MSTKKLAAVQKVLRNDAGMASWYADEHEVNQDSFTVQNVREYGLDGMGTLADQIIADGEDVGILTPGEVTED